MSDIKEARERYRTIVDFESDWTAQAEREIDFEAGDQWDDRIKSARLTDPQSPRPCLVMNHARKHLNNLVNDFRASRPGFKTLPADSHADVKTAEMMNGMLRHIQVSAEAPIAYDNAARLQMLHGLGFFRIGTEVSSPINNEQSITVSPIRSSFAVKMDPHAKHPAGRDATHCFVVEEMPRATFARRYPKADLRGFESDRELTQWHTENSIYVAEYWTLESRPAEIIETPFGVFRAEDLERRAPAMPPGFWVRAHTVSLPYVVCRKMNGAEFLDERVFPADYIPIVRVIGEERWINGKRDLRGIVRDIIDPQRILNYEASTNVERMSLEANAPWVGPDESFVGHEDAWSAANIERRAYLPYNQYTADGQALTPPSRNVPAPPNAASIAAQERAKDEIREISGMPHASFGGESSEKSGRALLAKQHQADQNTFHFSDNLRIAMTHAGRIILSMIPRVYDTERVVRVLGEDEKTVEQARVAPTGMAYQERQDAAGGIEKLYDLSVGTYDLVVDTGPSHLTQRTEAAEGAVQLVSNNPQLWAVMGDWLVRMLDWPGAEEIADRLKLMLPPEIKEMEQAKAEGKTAATMELQAIQQAMIAQVQPIIAQLEQALQTASVEADEKEAKVQELTQQLADKSAEYELKAMEINQREADSIRDHEAAMAAVKADIIKEAMGDSDAEQPSADIIPLPVNEDAAKLDTLVASEMSRGMNKAVEAMAEQVNALVAQMEGLSQQNSTLQATMDDSEKRRQVVRAEVVKFLKTDDETALARAVEKA